MESDFVKSWAIFINLASNSAAELLPISSFPLNSEELLYLIDLKIAQIKIDCKSNSFIDF